MSKEINEYTVGGVVFGIFIAIVVFIAVAFLETILLYGADFISPNGAAVIGEEAIPAVIGIAVGFLSARAIMKIGKRKRERLSP